MKGKLGLVAIMSTVALSTSVSYAQTHSSDPAETTLTSYLSAAEHQNIGGLLQYSADERGDSTYLTSLYTNRFKYSSDQLKAYSILSDTQNSANSETVVAQLSMRDGTVVDVGFNLIKNGSSWNVSIGKGFINDNAGYKLVNKPTAPAHTASNTVSPMSVVTELTNWNLKSFNSTWQSANTFDANDYGYNQLRLNLQQTLSSPYVGDTSLQANVKYFVTVPHWYGNSDWGSVDVIGTYWGSGHEAYIAGDGTNPAGCVLYIEALACPQISDPSTYTYDTFGELWTS